ncbi:MAG: cephalosporin-C deacetylase-like acetyl esterase [Flavobacteriales bacterium]|jgi:cephalosporin-C deacetylase-like acetyl esterase
MKMKMILASLLVLFFSVGINASELNVDDYAQLKSTTHMTLSPSGNLIAFRSRSEQYPNHLGIYSLKERKYINIVSLESLHVYKLHFIDENTVIIMGSEDDYYYRYNDHIEFSSAFSYNLKTKKIHQLLVPGKHVAVQTGLGNIIGISPDKKYAYMPAFKGAGRTNSTSEKMYYSLMKVDLYGKKRPKIHEQGNQRTKKYFVGVNGKVLAEYRFDDYHDKYSVVAYNNKNPQEIYNFKGKLSELSVRGLSEDEKSLVVSKYSDTTGYGEYHTMSLTDGKLTELNFVLEGRDIGHLYKDIYQHVSGIRYGGLLPSYYFFDESFDARVKKILEGFPGHSVYIEGWTPDKSKILIYVEGSNSSGDYYLIKSDGSANFVMSARPNIPSEDVNPIATFKFTASDGLQIPTLLTIPSAHVANMKNLPAIMLPHGGPESYDQIGFNWMAQAFANQGYLVIQPQFRGSAGFGIEHRNAGHGEWGKKMQSDLNESLQKLIKKGMVDPNRVCIVGSSYGGYAALAAGAFTPSLYRCVVSVNGISDLPRMISQAASERDSFSWVVDYWKRAMINGEGGISAMKAVSPARHADLFESPVLLIHGNEDQVVEFEQSKFMYKQLLKHGKDVQLIKLKKEDHYLSNSDTRTKALESLIGFVNTHIGEQESSNKAQAH